MDDLDQPSTAGAAAALPGSSRTIRQHAPRVEGVRRTSWGRALRWQDELHTCCNCIGAQPRVRAVRRTSLGDGA